MPLKKATQILFISSVYIFISGLFFQAASCSVLQDHDKKKRVENTWTVAAVKPEDKEAYTSVAFLESARFYKLPKDADPAYLKLLRESEKNHTRVVIVRPDIESDEIVKVKKP